MENGRTYVINHEQQRDTGETLGKEEGGIGKNEKQKLDVYVRR